MPPLESVGSGGGSVQRPAAMASDSGSGQPMTGARDGARQLAHAQDALALHVARLMHFALCPQADSSLHCLAAVARVNRPRCRVPVLPRPSSYLGLKDKCSVLYRTVPSLAPVSCFKHGSSTVFNTFNRYVSLCGACVDCGVMTLSRFANERHSGARPAQSRCAVVGPDASSQYANETQFSRGPWGSPRRGPWLAATVRKRPHAHS